MDRNGFWEIIDEAQRDGDDVYDVAECVVRLLRTLEPDEIINWGQHLSDVLGESYRWDLWAVAYIVNGGCGDDGFEYFRAFLIARGRRRFEAALADPQSIGDWIEPGENECEELLAVAWDAYLAKTGEELPDDAIKLRAPSDPIGERWQEDQLEQLYPQLCEKFF